MDKKLEKWIRWLEVIKGEIQDLVVAKYTFTEVQSIVRNNNKIQKNSSFYDYFTRTYVSHTMSGLRRQLKSDKQSISLVRLFEEMISSPETFSRSFYREKYEDSVVQEFADKDFNNFAKPDQSHIDATLIESDLSELRNITKRCEDFTDKRLAHRDKREPKEIPTFKDLDSCIELLDKLYVKYHLLFHATSIDTLLPTWQYDWKSIFRQSWIDDRDD
ncbi:AbiU2 domain-containing protein [Methylophaga thalassica]|uniref:AbiU2 domain-containing protein n=1 Tax=Methylophaga aminisulfidivorans TaxID=230105 RepID=UPI003A8DE5C2